MYTWLYVQTLPCKFQTTYPKPWGTTMVDPNHGAAAFLWFCVIFSLTILCEYICTDVSSFWAFIWLILWFRFSAAELLLEPSGLEPFLSWNTTHCRVRSKHDRERVGREGGGLGANLPPSVTTIVPSGRSKPGAGGRMADFDFLSITLSDNPTHFSNENKNQGLRSLSQTLQIKQSR